VRGVDDKDRTCVPVFVVYVECARGGLSGVRLGGGEAEDTEVGGLTTPASGT